VALVKCKECRSLVSTDAKVCPGCGIKKPGKPVATKTRLSFVLGGLVFAAIIMQVAKTPDDAAMRGATESTPVQQQCSQSPFEGFETGKIYVSGEFSELVDQICPSSKWSPDSTVTVRWQGKSYVLTSEKLPYDGVAAKYKLVSVRLID